ncbi:MAG: GNAT family N-acetyltransferase [Candidatus Latescibacteria bacterium]|nr:GNAT family N-acetyltransferase [Candidatus Latescibacterota bacterium]
MEAEDQGHPIGTASIGFRAPNEDDLVAIQAGWGRAVPQEYPLGSSGWPFRDFVLLSEKEGLSRVATIEDEIVGFASVFGGALRAIYVEDPYRRQGIGNTLLADMIGFAQGKEWNRLSVITAHGWVGTMPGLDIRYEDTVRFLEHRDFERGQIMADVEADFQAIETASRQRPLEHVCTVSEYHPDDMEDMKAFDDRAETKWSWVEWIEKHPQTDPKRVRLVARVEGQLVGWPTP